MFSISKYLLFWALGPQFVRGINALESINGIPSLIHLVEVLSAIESGYKVEITEKEIEDGLSELKKVMESQVENRRDIGEQQKEELKRRCGFIVSGCYDFIMFSLQGAGYRPMMK